MTDDNSVDKTFENESTRDTQWYEYQLENMTH